MSCNRVICYGQEQKFAPVLTHLSAAEVVKVSEMTPMSEVSKLVVEGTVCLITESDFFREDSGFRVSDLKKLQPFLPVVFIPEQGSGNTGKALAEGAIDYVTFDDRYIFDRFSNRCLEVSRRRLGERVEVGDLILDTFNRKIIGAKGQKHLSPTEISLVRTLALAKGNIVDRDIIKRECWGAADKVSDNALNRKLHEVRRAVGEVSDIVAIKTVYGHGFMLDMRSNS